MKLSDLVQFLNYLDEYNLNEVRTKSLEPSAAIVAMIQKSDCLDQTIKDSITHSLEEVDSAIQTFSTTVRSLKKTVMQQIIDYERELFEASTLWFNTAMNDEDLEYISNRKSVLVGDAKEQFNQRLRIHTSWQHPGLIFRPIHLTAFRDIVALDPMYLVDTDQDLLTAITKDFTERYQSRVRNYVIGNQQTPGRLLHRLPNHQFGLVAAQDFFNYKPIEFINRLIDEVFYLLKPGGAFVFTYNNCDYAGAVKLAESSFACYTPGRLIKQYASKVGYVINYDVTKINGTGILELGKPGEKTSLRGGQTLAIVKETIQDLVHQPAQENNENKKNKKPKVIDKSITKHYTEDERKHLQISAIVMEIDTEDNIIANYSAEKLDELVTNRLNTRDFNHDKFQKRLDKFIQKRKHK
jgi:SAM-dependent methyltransferase